MGASSMWATSFDKLREAFDQIAAELRSQYNIGYTPINTKLDGGYRKLEIKTRPRPPSRQRPQ